MKRKHTIEQSQKQYCNLQLILIMSYLIGNVAAAVNLLKSGKLGDNPTIVTILCDSGK